MKGWSMGRAREMMHKARERETGTLREKGMGRRRRRKRERVSRERRERSVTKVRRIRHDTGWTNEHTPAYASIRQHTSAYVRRIRYDTGWTDEHTSAYASIRQHMSAYVKHTDCPAVCAEESPARAAAYVSIRPHTSAYVSIRIALQYAPKNRLHAQQHTSASVGGDGKGGRVQDFFFSQSLAGGYFIQSFRNQTFRNQNQHLVTHVGS
jgi:hypothetical protein